MSTNETKYTDVFSYVMEHKYSQGNENWDNIAERVARHLVGCEEKDARNFWYERFAMLIKSKIFVPGGRILANSGRPKSNMFNCFIKKIDDSLSGSSGWAKTFHDSILIAGTGGGIGYDFSLVRPRGFKISGVGGQTHGSVALMDSLNALGHCISGGQGRGIALLFGLPIWHGDIKEFILAKSEHERLRYANVSVMIDDEKEFLKHLDDPDYEIDLKHNSVVVGKANLKSLVDDIISNMIEHGEPGFINRDAMNRDNNHHYYAGIDCTNPSLRSGTKILTAKGIIPIEQLENKEFSVRNLDGIWSKAKCWLSGKNQRLYKITLKNKREIFCTAEHKWPIQAVGGNFIKAKTTDLVSGNLLPMPEYTSLGLESDNTFTYKEGFSIGWLYGDGWFGKRCASQKLFCGFIFSEKEKYLATDILEFINSHKEDRSNLCDNKDGTYGFQIGSQPFNQWLKDRFGVDEKEYGIPKQLWTSNENFIKGFIDGLFSSDGYVSKENYIQLTSAHEQLLLDVQDILSFYGIKSKIYMTDATTTFPNGNSGVYRRYDLKLSPQHTAHFAKIFTMSHEDKNIQLQKIAKINWEDRRKDYKNVMEIVSVEPTDLYEDVWDISVYDETHCFQIAQVITGNCGEVSHCNNGVCNLGSIDVSQLVNTKGEVDRGRLKSVVSDAVRMLDNAYDCSIYPTSDIETLNKGLRRIGLGIMGLHHYLLKRGIKYSDLKKSVPATEEIMKLVCRSAYWASVELAEQKGPFSLYNEKFLESGFCKRALTDSLREEIKQHGIRNATLISIAPTGTISRVAGCSPGLEPSLAKAARIKYNFREVPGKKSREYDECNYIDPVFLELLARGKEGLFETAEQINLEAHLSIQTAVQIYVDASVSKTVNFEAGTLKKDDVKKLLKEYFPKLKGFTLMPIASELRSGGTQVPVEEKEWRKWIDAGTYVSKYSGEDTTCKSGTCEI